MAHQLAELAVPGGIGSIWLSVLDDHSLSGQDTYETVLGVPRPNVARPQRGYIIGLHKILQANRA